MSHQSPIKLIIIFVLLVSLILAGCSSEGDGGVGSISFDFVLAGQERPAILTRQHHNQVIFACEENGVETIEAQVLDENGVLLAEGGPWLCTEGEGIISGLDAGNNRIVKIIARNSEGQIVFAGRSEPFSILAGETTNVGTVELVIAGSDPITNEDTAITDEDREVIIPILDNDPNLYYNTSGDYFGTLDATTVTVVSPPLSGNTLVNVDGTVTYTPSPDTNGQDYFTYTIQDDFGDTSSATLVTLTINPMPDVPAAPQEVTATPAIGQITLNWMSVADATSYTVYFSQTSGVSKDNFDGVFRNISLMSFTHSNLTGGDTFFYAVTAQNDIGESDESAEVSATVLSANTRLIGEFRGTGFGIENIDAELFPWSGLFDATFDGSGNENYQVIASSDNVLEPGIYTYELDIDGSMTVTLDTGIEYTGILNADNNVLAIADTDFSPDPDAFIEMDVAIKKSTGLTDAILSGEYTGVRISSLGTTALISVTFSGEGNGTFQYLANSVEQILNGEFTYSVDSDGSSTINNLVAVASSGIVSEDGRILSLVDTDSLDDEEISKIILIRTEAALSNAIINGDYIGVRFGYSIGQVTIPDSTVMSINADGNGNMVFEILSSSSGNADPFNATYDVDSTNGRIRINLPSEEILEGAVNADGEIFNFINTDLNDSFIEIGVAIRKTQ